MSEQQTKAGKALLVALHDHSPSFLGGSRPSESRYVAAIEVESRNATLDEVLRVVEELIVEAGGECHVPDDIENPICLTHSEVLFDGACEDQPRQLRAVLDAVKALRS